jgi:hypothetical protein
LFALLRGSGSPVELSCAALRFACMSRQGWPMVLSLWFLYDAEKLYGARGQVVNEHQKRPCGISYSLFNPCVQASPDPLAQLLPAAKIFIPDI